MELTETVSTLELVWTITAFVGFLTALVFGYDAYRDKLVLYAAGDINTARSELADGHIFNASSKAIALSLHAVIGLVAMTQTNRSSLVGTIIASGFLLAEFALVSALIRNHLARKKILTDETAIVNERLRLAAEAERVSERIVEQTRKLEENTQALDALTSATNEQTHMISNGPLAAQIAATLASKDNTRATDANTASQDVANVAEASNTLARAASDAANTLAVDSNTSATDRNTGVKDGNNAGK